MKYSIAVDFDGVIHQYVSQWVDEHTIPDPPMPGAFAWLRQMVEHYRVIVYSSRLPAGLSEMGRWFEENGGQDLLERLEFWDKPGKPTALIYVDDRGFRFEGAFPTLEQIRTRPWKYSPGEAA